MELVTLFQEVFLNLFEYKNILITGTSRGIGKDLAKIYLKKGHIVFGCSRKNSNLKHKNYNHKKLNLNNEKNLESWLKNLKKKKILFDIVVLNAGTIDRSFLIEQKNKLIKNLIGINLYSNIVLIKSLFNLSILNQNSSIIFFSSISTIFKNPGTAIYSALKKAMETIIKILAKELKYTSIKFMIFKITYIQSQMSKNLNYKYLNELKSKVKINNLKNTMSIYKKIDEYSKKNKMKKISIFQDQLIK